MFKGSIAVLLAAHQGEAYLEPQVNSILAQRGVAVTLYISIDNSTDATRHLAEKMAQADDRIVLLNDGSYGSAAKHFLHLLSSLPLAAYDAVALADQDDIWLSDHLERGLLALAQGAQGYSSNVLAFWPNGRELLVVKSQPQRAFDFLFESAGPGGTFVIGKELLVSIKRQLHKHADIIPSIHHHDWLIYAIARGFGFTWFIDSAVGLRYRQHGDNELGVNWGFKALVMRATKVLGDGGFVQALLVAKVAEQDTLPVLIGITQGSRMNYLRLAYSARLYRRALRDQCLFAGLCCYLALFPHTQTKSLIKLQ